MKKLDYNLKSKVRLAFLCLQKVPEFSRKYPFLFNNLYDEQSNLFISNSIFFIDVYASCTNAVC